MIEGIEDYPVDEEGLRTLGHAYVTAVDQFGGLWITDSFGKNPMELRRVHREKMYARHLLWLKRKGLTQTRAFSLDGKEYRVWQPSIAP